MADYFEEARQTDTTTAVTTEDTTMQTTALAAPSTEGPTIMAYPPGVSLATITIGAGRTMFGAAPKLISATVTPIFVGTPHVVHTASGWAFYPTPRTFRVENGEELTFELPHVDAAGWRDTAGNEFPALLESGERDRGWAYHAKFTVIGGSGQDAIPHRYEKVFQPLVGQTEPLDLDLVPDGLIGAPVSAPMAVVSSIAGLTGPVSVEQLQAVGLGGLGEDDVEALAAAAADQAVLDAGTYTDLKVEDVRSEVTQAGYLTDVPDASVAEHVANTDSTTRAAVETVANASAAVVRNDLTPGNGNRPVGKGELVVNVRDFGATGDGVTDDLGAIEDAAAAVSAAGGGTLLFPQGRYFVNRAIYCASNVSYVGERATIINTRTAGSVFLRSAFMPGYIHGYGFYSGNANQFPRVSIQDVPRGATTITASTAGGFSTVQVGDFIAVRSLSNYTTSNIEIPSLLYFTKVRAKSGDTITLGDGIPQPITGALIHHLVGSPKDGAGVEMRMVENVSIRGFITDSASTLQGGGCYGFRISDVVQAPGRFGSLMTLNAMVHFEVSRCQTEFSYTFCEAALGCSDGWIHDNIGSYRPGASTFHPMSFVEGCNNIRFERNTVTVNSDYVGSGYGMINMVQCRNIRITDNNLVMTGNVNSIFGIASAVVQDRTISDVHITDNQIVSGPSVNRVFSIGATSNADVPPQRLVIRGNIISGEVAASPNQWLRIQRGVDYVIADNVTPSGAAHEILSAARGRFDGALQSASYPYMVTVPEALTGYARNTGVANLGRIPMRGAVTSVRVQVLTAFDGTGNNTLDIGYNGGAGIYVTGIDVSAAGVKYYVPGSPGAGSKLGAKETVMNRDVLATYNGTGSTTGSAIVTVYYEPTNGPF